MKPYCLPILILLCLLPGCSNGTPSEGMKYRLKSLTYDQGTPIKEINDKTEVEIFENRIVIYYDDGSKTIVNRDRVRFVEVE